MTEAVLGVIGGPGLEGWPGLQDAQWVAVASPWGAPSDQVLIGFCDDLKVVILPRFGRGGTLAPSSVNDRANIDVLKRCGVTDLVSVSSCRSLQQELVPGTAFLADQFIDQTYVRPKSFFGTGCVAHVSMADLVSPALVGRLETAAKAEHLSCHSGGIYLAMEGPQFATRAESALYRSWGCAVTGMTAMPEAKLAREAEISYAALAVVGCYDSWHPDAGVDGPCAGEALASRSADAVRALLARLAKAFPRAREACPAGSDRALEDAIVTDAEKRDPALVAKLDAVAGRVLSR